VSKHWKPGKATVKLDTAPRPSRIRREPVRLNANVVAKPQRPLNYRELELYGGIAGILVFAALIAAMIIGLAVFTVFRGDPEADARAMRYSQCYNAQGPNCVLDGGTIYANGERVEIAGLDAPGIGDAKCDREHDRGVEAASELAELLNSGPVTIGKPFRDQNGRRVSKVEVKGRDVALKMIGDDVAHETNSGLAWCH
jgi:endonuclease YncB( thermonuclease family)